MSPRMSRRGFLAASAGALGAIAAEPLLAACGSAAPPAKTGAAAWQHAEEDPADLHPEQPRHAGLPEHQRVVAGLHEIPGQPGEDGQRDPGIRRQLHRDHAAVGHHPVGEQPLRPGGEQGARRHRVRVSRQRQQLQHDPPAAVLRQQAARLDPGADVLGTAAELRPGRRGQARRPHPLPGRRQDQGVSEPRRDLPGRLAVGRVGRQALRIPVLRRRVQHRLPAVLPGGRLRQARHRDPQSHLHGRPARPGQGGERSQGQALGDWATCGATCSSPTTSPRGCSTTRAT